MKIHYLVGLGLLSLISATAQNKIIPQEGTYQFTKNYERGISKENAVAVFSKEHKLDSDFTFKSKTIATDRLGNSHERMQQFYKGIQIVFGEIIAHSDANGFVNSVNGEIYRVGDLNTNPALSKEAAFAHALQNKTSVKYLWDDLQSAEENNYKKPTGELVILPLVHTGEVKLAYKFDLYSVVPLYRDEVYVDASNGKILYVNPIIKHAGEKLLSKESLEQNHEKIEALVTGNAATRYSGARTIETTFNTPTSKYILKDVTRGNGIETYNCARTNTYPTTNFSDSDNNWTSAEFANLYKDNGALDAHWGAEMTYDFWSTVFGRNSFDNLGSKIKSYVHYSESPPAGFANAFWNGSVMTYGDGSGTIGILTSIDVCAHEIGHAVCSYTADLAYQNQSGALNEGFSDIWGACIEQFGRNAGTLNVQPAASSNIWKIAEDLSLTGNPFRSMSNPNSKNDPDTFKGTFYITTADDGSCIPVEGNDYCGVHTNSSVLNHWFFMVTSGEIGTNNATPADTYIVSGIGMQKSSEIAFFAERDYLTSNATFADTRAATITVAQSLYCPNSPEVIAVTNAWFAVNVGEAYSARINDVTATELNSNLSPSCASAYNPIFKFQNSGSSTITSVNISYAVDGGTVTNTTWTGTLAPCGIVNFPLSIGNLSTGNHTLSVTSTLLNDEDTTNNTRTALVNVNASGTVNAINTFENPSDNLVTYDSNGSNVVWERGNLGTKTVLTNAVAGGTKVYATKLNGNYPDKKESYLVSKCYDLTSISSPTIKFDMGFDLEQDWDIVYVQYSTNNGVNWSNLGTGTSATWYTSNRTPNGTDCFNCMGGQWTGLGNSENTQGGSNKDRHTYSYGLSSLSTQSNVIFRIVMLSDDAVNNEGAYIDDFQVYGSLATPTNDFQTFTVSPNPSSGAVTIQLSTSEKVTVSLYDIRGRMVYNQTFTNSSAMFNQEITFHNLQQGLYLLNVATDGKKATKKLLIK